MFKAAFILIPFGVSRIKESIQGRFIGYADYRIFGIRIARIQETKPWE